MCIERSTYGNEVAIRVSGRFDFDSYRDFRNAYRHTDGAAHRYIVDLSDVEYLASAAFGMLMALRRHAGTGIDRVTLRGARGNVRRLLELAGFPSVCAIDPERGGMPRQRTA